MGTLLIVLFLVFALHVLIKGVLPYRGLRYLMRRANGEVPQNKLFEDIVELGTGVSIDTPDTDK